VSAEQFDALPVGADSRNGATVLTPRGVLDSTTYRSLRDRIIKAALEEPAAVIVDVADLVVPIESAWAVFTSARWHVNTWPEVPVLLACGSLASRNVIARNGVCRYVPVYPSVQAAVDALPLSAVLPCRRRARADLPAGVTSLHRSRELVSDWLTAWSQPDMIAVTKVIVTALVENVLEHTTSAPCVRLESDGRSVTVAVEDASPCQAGLREERLATRVPSGLRIVDVLCRAWGNAPTSTGKTVWVVIGPENRL
jgi:hypothetical protein